MKTHTAFLSSCSIRLRSWKINFSTTCPESTKRQAERNRCSKTFDHILSMYNSCRLKCLGGRGETTTEDSSFAVHLTTVGCTFSGQCLAISPTSHDRPSAFLFFSIDDDVSNNITLEKNGHSVLKLTVGFGYTLNSLIWWCRRNSWWWSHLTQLAIAKSKKWRKPGNIARVNNFRTIPLACDGTKKKFVFAPDLAKKVSHECDLF